MFYFVVEVFADYTQISIGGFEIDDTWSLTCQTLDELIFKSLKNSDLFLIEWYF